MKHTYTVEKEISFTYVAYNRKTGEMIEKNNLNDLVAAVEWTNISDNYNYGLDLKMKDWDFDMEVHEG